MAALPPLTSFGQHPFVPASVDDHTYTLGPIFHGAPVSTIMSVAGSEISPVPRRDDILASNPFSDDFPILPRKEIYRQIGEILCHITTTRGTATGFCVSGNLIAVPFHVLTETDGNPDRITVVHDNVVYTAVYFSFCPLDKARRIDCAIFEVQESDFPSGRSINFFDKEIEPGEQIYFGGFPFTQKDPTFHSGYVSSASFSANISYFTIDATVVPGNSGGPVFVLERNRLKLAGFIDQQLADINPEFIRIKEQLGPEVRRRLMPQLEQATVYISGVCLNKLLGVVVETLSQSIDTLFANISTGIGSVVHVQHLKTLISGEDNGIALPIRVTGLPVVHRTLKTVKVSEEKPLESIAKTVNKTVCQSIIDYFNAIRKGSFVKKRNLYAKFIGNYENIDKSRDPEWHFDRQAQRTDGGANLQMQVGHLTIATIEISPKLLNYHQDPGKMAEVVNYVAFKFIGGVNYFQKHKTAAVLHVIPREEEEKKTD